MTSRACAAPPPVFLVALVAAAAGCVPGPAPLPTNHPPTARVIVPQLWPASEPVTVDGSLSDDPDLDALRFSLDWGDGTPSIVDDDGIAQHTYEAAGTYAVELLVEDAGGVPAHVDASVVLVGDRGAACTCDLGCFDDAVCTARGCLLFRSSAPGDQAPAGAFTDAVDCTAP